MQTAHLIVMPAIDPDVVIPIVVPAVTFMAIIVLVGIVLTYRFRALRVRQELYASFLDKGIPIPTELLLEKQTQNGDLRRGLVLLAGGLGLSAAFLCAHEADGAGFGFIPALVGIAYLIVWKVESKRDAEGARGIGR